MQALKSPKASLTILLTGILLLHLGSYMVLPLLPIFLKVQKEMSIAEIGLILAVSPFTFQAGSLLGGLWADRIGRRTIIAIGAWINAVALAGYAFFDTLWLFVVMGLLGGFGIGLNAPATKAAIATIASTQNKQTTAFSLRGIAANIGTAAAGLLTFYVLGGASVLVFYTAAVLFVVLGLMSWLLLPKGCGDEVCERVPIKSYLTIFQNKAFVVFSIVSILVWALYTQFSLSLPLRAETILPDPSIVSLIWTINSFIVIVLQTPVSRWIIEKIHPFTALALGMMFIAGGLGTLYWSTHFYWLVMSGAIFIIGEILIVPTMDSTISRLGTAKMVGVLFGISNFASGIGEGAGKFLGAQLINAGTGSALPWLIYAIAGLGVSALWMLLRFWKPIRSESLESAEEVPKAMRYRTLLDWVLGRKRRAR